MKGIYEFSWDCGRSGSLEGVFVASQEDVKNIVGKHVYFGEVLGKHSEVYGDISEDDFTLKTDDQEFITKFEQVMGEGWSSGYSPFDYLPDDEDEE